MVIPCFVVLAISICYFIDTNDAEGATAFTFVGFLICMFLFSGHSDIKKIKAKTEYVNGKKQKMILMRYIGYETYTTAFGNKKKRRVWKEKWVKEEEYIKRKYRPYITRPWEARFFD